MLMDEEAGPLYGGGVLERWSSSSWTWTCPGAGGREEGPASDGRWTA